MSENNGCGFIPDGYTRKVYIKGVPGLYPDLNATIRPMLRWECLAMWDRESMFKGEGKAKERDLVAAAAIVDHVVEWDFPHPKTAQTFARMVPALAARLAQIVLGSEPDDSAPPSETEAKQAWQLEIEAMARGESVELLESGN